MTKTLNQIFFFSLHQNQNIFFSNIVNQNIFLEKKHNPPPPPPFKLNGRSLRSLELLHVKDEHRNAQLNIVSRGLVKTARGDNNHRTKQS